MRYIMIFIILVLSTVACQMKVPVQEDGRLTLSMVAEDTSGILTVDPLLGYAPVSNTEVVLQSNKYRGEDGELKKYYTETDKTGFFEFDDLPVSEYLLTILKDTTYVDPDNGEVVEVTIGSYESITLDRPNFLGSSKTHLMPKSPLTINEIYYSGPVNNAHYFYDQYVELYNSADTAVYLDGKILCRERQARPLNIDEVDYVQVIYVYQFPGEPLTGRSYPLAPKTFTVVAMDAIDHSAFVNGAADLSTVAWEFYNPYAGDMDNPAGNVTNVIPENSTDFMINVVHNAIILGDGSEYYYGEISASGYQYIHIPIETVLDGVEYSANPEKQKELTFRVDAGFAGVGIGKYTGKSTQRRLPGYDTNNSSLDFIVLNHPTPGYQR